MRYQLELLSIEPLRAQSVLNDRAAAGWRLVTAFPMRQGPELLLYCVLERPEEVVPALPTVKYGPDVLRAIEAELLEGEPD